jgi:hypothetical protein
VNGLLLPWSIRYSDTTIRDAEGDIVADWYQSECAEAIVEAMNATMPKPSPGPHAGCLGCFHLHAECVCDAPVYAIVTVPEGREVARGTSANEAWERAAGHDGAVKMEVRR